MEKRCVRYNRQPPAYDISGKLDDFQENQENFNKQLLSLLHGQQKYINKLVENQDKNIEQENHLISPEKHNKDFLNQILAEHKVKIKLEEEALILWENKPAKERMKSAGCFRVEEDKEKRNVFIKEYINKNFEIYLKEELNLH